MLNSLFQNFHTFAITCGKPSFFGLPSWYSYLQVKESPVTHACEIVNFKIPGDFILIALAILDILLRAAGLVAIAFVIYGGIQYITSQGEPDKTAKAQSTIIDALVGLALALVSIGLVSFLGSKLG